MFIILCNLNIFASQTSLILSALSQMLVLVHSTFSFILLLSYLLRLFFICSENQYWQVTWKPVLPQTQSQLLRKSSFQSRTKLQVCCSLQSFFHSFINEPAQETRNFKVCCAIFLCNLLIVTVSYLLASLTLA